MERRSPRFVDDEPEEEWGRPFGDPLHFGSQRWPMMSKRSTPIMLRSLGSFF